MSTQNFEIFLNFLIILIYGLLTPEFSTYFSKVPKKNKIAGLFNIRPKS